MPETSIASGRLIQKFAAWYWGDGQCQAITGNAEECGMSQAHQPRKPDQEIQAHGEYRHESAHGWRIAP